MNDYYAAEAAKNGLCSDFTGRCDEISLHTSHPGTTGANESEVDRVALSWATPMDGKSAATAVFEDLVGTYPWAGLWNSGSFQFAIEVNIVNIAARDVSLLITHEVD